MKNFFIKHKIAALSALFTVAAPASAYAITPLSDGVLDTVTKTFEPLQHKWFAALSHEALILFMLLLTIDVCWLGIQSMLTKKPLEELFPSVVKKLIVACFFLAILQNAGSWIPDIINSFTDAGTLASGMGGLSPSGIMTNGVNIAAQILGAAPANAHTGTMFGNALAAMKADITGGFLIEYVERLLVAIAILLSFTMIALEMCVTLIQSYFVLGAGVLFLGAGGSRWTTKYVDAYLNFAISTGAKLFTIYLLVGAISTAIVPTLVKDLTINLGAGGGFNLQNGFGAAGTCVIIWMLVKKIPEMTASMLSGSLSTGAGDVGQAAGGMAMLAAGTVAIAATGGTAAVGAGGTAISMGRKMAGMAGNMASSAVSNAASGAVQASGGNAVPPPSGGGSSGGGLAGSVASGAVNAAMSGGGSAAGQTAASQAAQAPASPSAQAADKQSAAPSPANSNNVGSQEGGNTASGGSNAASSQNGGTTSGSTTGGNTTSSGSGGETAPASSGSDTAAAPESSEAQTSNAGSESASTTASPAAPAAAPTKSAVNAGENAQPAPRKSESEYARLKSDLSKNAGHIANIHNGMNQGASAMPVQANHISTSHGGE